ncbi:sialate O-acetylesterase [Sorangium sp. So ce590]|uniref:sialate O-acetylesterase n=1 Tax=unclassified Sorangium TaxID=2621164 RepID=UPI003F63405A
MKRSCIALAAGVMSLSASVMAQPVKVFVLAGQSNMVGFGVGAALPAEIQSQPDIWYDHHNPDARTGGPYAAATSADWGPLEPKGEARRYGPEITFGRAMAAAYPEHRIAIVKMAQGGTNLVDHWGRGLAPDPEVLYKSQLYHALLGKLDSATYAGDRALRYPDEPTRLDNALARLESEGHDVEIAALVWMQGENEAGWSAAFRYGDALRAFIAAVRADLGVPELPVVLGRISDNLYPANGGPIAAGKEANIDAVRAAQVTVAEEDPRVAWVDTDDFTPRPPSDAWHFDSAAYQLLGQRFAEAYLALAAEAGSSSASSASSAASAGAGGGGATAGSSGSAAATGSAGSTGSAGAGGGGAGGGSATAGSSGSAAATGSAGSTGSAGAGGGGAGGGSATVGSSGSTAATGSAGSAAGSSGAAPGGAGGSSGCSCGTAGGPDHGPTAAALALIALAGLRRRRGGRELG